MTGDIARAIIDDKLNALRNVSYGALVRSVGQVSCEPVNGPDGEEYQMEIETRWDSKTGGNIRVIVSVEGPGVSTLKPLTGDFIKSADGSFIGEP
jgi:hypothetical protein